MVNQRHEWEKLPSQRLFSYCLSNRRNQYKQIQRSSAPPISVLERRIRLVSNKLDTRGRALNETPLSSCKPKDLDPGKSVR
jgi:hypothetical protein